MLGSFNDLNAQEIHRHLDSSTPHDIPPAKRTELVKERSSLSEPFKVQWLLYEPPVFPHSELMRFTRRLSQYTARICNIHAVCLL